MKSNKIATYALLGGLAVAGAGAGAATLANAEPTATPSASPSAPADPSAAPSTGTQDQGGPGQGRHGRGGMDATMAKDLAGKLGVDEAKVTEALQAIRTEERATRQQGQQGQQNGTKPDPAAREAEMAKKLAEKLGVDEAKVTTALNELRQAHQADEKAAFKTKLDQAVTDGKLTRAEADAVQKAADAGVIGMGGRR